MAKSITMVYMAGPIDLDPTDSKREWREEAAKQLLEGDIATFSPAHAFSWKPGCDGGSQIRSINWAALDTCRAMLCFLPANTPTIGTIMELQYCLYQEYNIYLVTGIQNSIYLDDPRIRQFKSIREAIKAIVHDAS